MAKKHVQLVAKGTRAYQAANKTLTYVGRYKGGGYLYSDLGLAKNWQAYQRERRVLGLPAARD